MEAMSLTNCPSCGTPAGPADVFCQTCGARVGYAPSYPGYYPPMAPPHSESNTLIIVLVVLLVVVMLVFPAIMYVMVSGLITGPGTAPRAIGVTVMRSTDGSDWVLTFTSVPTSLSVSATMLTLISSSGTPMLSSTSLSSLEGAGMSGVTYMPAAMGSMYCNAGDRLLASTTTYPSGTQYEIINGGSILASGQMQ